MTPGRSVHPDAATLWAWRHPLPQGVAGRCIGTTDVPVDRRKAKRLAHRIRRACAGHPGPKRVFTSDLRRCADVGRFLRGRGWSHGQDPALREMHFGDWEGRAWSDIDRAEVDRWVARFADHAPGGGESLRACLARVARWSAVPAEGPPSPPGEPRLLTVVVAHAGWMLSRQWLATHGRASVPAQARDWPRSPAYGSCWALAASVP